jgi:hypothetical protein
VSNAAILLTLYLALNNIKVYWGFLALTASADTTWLFSPHLLTDKLMHQRTLEVLLYLWSQYCS